MYADEYSLWSKTKHSTCHMLVVVLSILAVYLGHFPVCNFRICPNKFLLLLRSEAHYNTYLDNIGTTNSQYSVQLLVSGLRIKPIQYEGELSALRDVIATSTVCHGHHQTTLNNM